MAASKRSKRIKGDGMIVKYESEMSSAKLCKAILIYQGSTGSAFATVNTVGDKGIVLAGAPLDNADVEELFKTDGNRNGSGYLPENILEFSRETITWHVKQKTAPIFFKATSTTGREMNKINGKNVRWPALLFRLKRQSLQCWALTSDKRPEPSTALYRAPFWNTGDGATVCMPSGIREKLWSKNGIGNISLATIQGMQNAFYESAFSHPSGDATRLFNYKGGHDAYWLAAVKSPAAKFPVSVLIKTKLKLKDILK